MRGTLAGSLEVRLSTFLRVQTLNEMTKHFACRRKANIVTVPNCKSATGSGGMLRREILRLQSSEIARNVYFSSTFSRRATKLREKGHVARDFEKQWGCTCPLSRPVPTSMAARLSKGTYRKQYLSRNPPRVMSFLP